MSHRSPVVCTSVCTPGKGYGSTTSVHKNCIAKIEESALGQSKHSVTTPATLPRLRNHLCNCRPQYHRAPVPSCSSLLKHLSYTVEKSCLPQERCNTGRSAKGFFTALTLCRHLCTHLHAEEFALCICPHELAHSRSVRHADQEPHSHRIAHHAARRCRKWSVSFGSLKAALRGVRELCGATWRDLGQWN